MPVFVCRLFFFSTQHIHFEIDSCDSKYQQLIVFIADQYFIVLPGLAIYLLVDLGCYQFGAVTKKAVRNIHVQVSVRTYAFISVDEEWNG